MSDNMLSRIAGYARKVLSISPSVPAHVDIEISTACNLKCKMCKRETIDFGDKLMPFEELTAIIDKLPRGVEMVSFGGYGEMLLHPRFCDMVRYAKQKGFKTETTSNGTLLHTDDRIIAILDSGIDSLRISVDHVREPAEEKDVGHVFSQKLLSNLKRLAELRKERTSSIQLGINTVVHAGNVDEVIDIIKTADGIGFDLVELIRLDTCHNHAERTLQYEKEAALYVQVEHMQRRIEVVTPSNRFAKWRRAYNLGREFCPFRFQSAHIRMGGQVTPCAFGFAVHDFGSIHEKPLTEIWRSDAFRAIRADHKNPTCQSCGIFKWGKPLPRKELLPILQ